MKLSYLANAFSTALTALDRGIDRIFETGTFFDAIDHFDLYKSGELGLSLVATADQFNEDGLQPLHYAIVRGNSEAVDWLLQEHAAPVHGTSEREFWNAAHFAVHYWKCALIERLAAVAPKTPNFLAQTDSLGRTPLMLALEINAPSECVAQLIRHGAPFTGRIGRKRQTLLHFAIRARVSEDAFEALLSAALGLRDESDANGRTAVNLAAAMGRVDLMQVLIRHDADLLTVDNGCSNILHCAVSSGQVSVLLSLAEADFSDAELAALLHAPNSAGLTPLMLAVQAGSEEIVRFLVALAPTTGSQSHINALQPGSRNTALHVAVLAGIKNRLAVVQAILAGRRSSVNLRNADGHTALDLARMLELTDVAEELELFDFDPEDSGSSDDDF